MSKYALWRLAKSPLCRTCGNFAPFHIAIVREIGSMPKTWLASHVSSHTFRGRLHIEPSVSIKDSH